MLTALLYQPVTIFIYHARIDICAFCWLFSHAFAVSNFLSFKRGNYSATECSKMILWIKRSL